MTGSAYTVQGTSAVIRLDNPPVNGLSYELRRAIVDGIDGACADPRVSSIVIVGTALGFSGGADIRELGRPKARCEPTMTTVIRAVEEASKPVIAAMEKFAVGGGLELALACHYRVVKSGTQVALPEVKLGLLPGAGGTQRLPRMVGVERALNMILSGQSLPIEEFQDSDLVDARIERELLPGAVAFAEIVVAKNKTHRRVRDIVIEYPDPDGYFDIARTAAAASSRHLPAPVKCVDAVYAAVTKSFEEGLEVERDAFLYLAGGPESRALRHSFSGERAAAKIPDVPVDTVRRDIRKVAVIGAGTMGRGIAMAFLNAGIPVQLLETTDEALQKGLASIRESYESTAQKGRLTGTERDARLGPLTGTLEYSDIGAADLVIEAVFEEMGVKQAVFRKLDAVMKAGAILASNTSTLDLNQIAASTRRPEDVIGLHFFSPAHVMRLLEVVRGAATANDVLATVMRLARDIGKVGVLSGVCDGFIGNRMLLHYIRAAGFLVEEGATPHQVDRALEKWGMAMGPFRMGDMAGLDISWAVRKRRYVQNPAILYPKFVDRLCEQGRFGQKTGKGWYLYAAGTRKAIPDPEVERMLTDYRRDAGISIRKISDAEIVERCIYALINEGSRVLQEGIAQRASDIDIVFLNGYGFPAHRGGPMLFADEVGLYNVIRAARRFARTTGDEFWEPAWLMAALGTAGATFN